MAGNVVAQGELIQFKSLLRCEACQLGNHKCVLQESDDRCILCSGSDSECIFIRSGSGQVRASKSTFPWSWLIYETSTDLFDITTYVGFPSGEILLCCSVKLMYNNFK